MSEDRIYTEADMAAEREKWERIYKEREWTNQLSHLSGQLAAMPELMRSIAREVVNDTMDNRAEVRWDRWPVLANLMLLSAGMAYQIFHH